eukprot:CAMPEP_0119009106 /NCGR_PEP_ID=MMETSP1176-20130426/4147_1 /TAXON_ID=265551 /ORGANISM="Synedropsis recta cf, Strain CCMP1620" /LENGTH=149 /DNA_ID=CAMNT_0006961559 /DNA_START=81 /DNA_END=530 /DNA_ORIENTATION=-
MSTTDYDVNMLSASFADHAQVCYTTKEQGSPNNTGSGEIDDSNRTPLPSGWIEQPDAFSKAPFYMNPEKGETTWKRPVASEGTSSDVKNVAVEGALPSDTSNDVTTTDAAPVKDALPEGWVELKDAFSGVSYYVSDGETTWKRPVKKSP